VSKYDLLTHVNGASDIRFLWSEWPLCGWNTCCLACWCHQGGFPVWLCGHGLTGDSSMWFEGHLCVQKRTVVFTWSASCLILSKSVLTNFSEVPSMKHQGNPLTGSWIVGTCAQTDGLPCGETKGTVLQLHCTYA